MARRMEMCAKIANFCRGQHKRYCDGRQGYGEGAGAKSWPHYQGRRWWRLFVSHRGIERGLGAFFRAAVRSALDRQCRHSRYRAEGPLRRGRPGPRTKVSSLTGHLAGGGSPDAREATSPPLRRVLLWLSREPAHGSLSVRVIEPLGSIPNHRQNESQETRNTQECNPHGVSRQSRRRQASISAPWCKHEEGRRSNT